MSNFFQLIVLFFVIFDPPASFLVFFSASSLHHIKERKKMALYAFSVAFGLSMAVLIFGNGLLRLFSTSIHEFKVAGGILLLILGVKMALGKPLTDLHESKGNSNKAIAALIGTPLLTGPAAITAIIIAVQDYGRVLTGCAVSIVLLVALIMLYYSDKLYDYVGSSVIQILSTILGLITVAWGVRFVTSGLLVIFGW